MQRNQQLRFNFAAGQRPQPDKDGHIATTMEWARKLSADDVKVLRGQAPYSERVPNVDEGFSEADCRQATQHLEDRKSTRLNSSHGSISYAVFCLKKKKSLPAAGPPLAPDVAR